MKRYAIVRVDNTWCPNKFENVDNRFVCDSRKKNIKYVHCERCLYGDTKEQFINKITTAIEIAITMYEKGLFLNDKNKNKSLAKFIVEFLGVDK